MNNAWISDYFQYDKIDKNGKINKKSPLLISNNFSKLILYLAQSNPVSKIIIDGFNAINERRSDFAEIDKNFNIPTVLITDLSEIDTFEDIRNFGFEFFNYTKENITINKNNNQSPFEAFEKKLSNYVLIKFEKEVCINSELETASQKLHSLPEDDSNNDLNILKISLIQLFNFLSRICHVPGESEILNYSQKIVVIESYFIKCKLWLGDANKQIEEIISVLKYFVEQLAKIKTEKCIRLEELMKQSKYDYIICATEEEANSLAKHINAAITNVIPVADVNDNLLTGKNVKAILTGWPKSNNLNKIIFSFLFTELNVLFYQFENRYYTSLQKRNHRNSNNIKTTVNKSGVRYAEEKSKPKGFEELYSIDDVIETPSESSFDIVEFELKLDNAQYLKRVLDHTQFNDRSITQGSAGTGKTMIAMESAVRAALEGKIVFLTCFNRLIGEWMQKQLEEYKGIITVSSLHSFMIEESKGFDYDKSQSNKQDFYSKYLPLLLSDIYKKGISKKFDKLILDEGQDLIREEYLKLFDSMLNDGLANGNCEIYGDFERQAIFSQLSKEEMFSLIGKIAQSAKFFLKINCRNTKQIGEETSLISGFEKPPFLLEYLEGIPVEYNFYINQKHQAELLERHLKLLFENGLPLNEMIILSPKKFENSCAGSLAGFTIMKIKHTNAISTTQNFFGFATVQAYKGMESNYVLITDIEDLSSEAAKSLLYVGMSRARYGLIFLIAEPIRSQYRNILKNKLN